MNSDLSVRAASAYPTENDEPGSIDENGIHQLVHGFYVAVRNDPLLGPIFDREIAAERWPEHLDKMCAFWSSVLLRTTRYGGRPLPPHLALAEIADPHFEQWLRLFRHAAWEAFDEAGAATVTGFAERIAHSFRLAIAFHRSEDATHIERRTAG